MSDSASTQAAQLRHHFAHVILPIWRGSGFDRTMQLPFEAVDPATHAPLPVTRYRAMACARQLFVFAQAGEAGHAATLFDALCRRFRDTRHGGWHFSIDAAGAPLDTTKDLYTHAFIVFACAAHYAASGERAARTAAEDTAALIQDRFAPQRGSALLDAARHDDFSSSGNGPLQNPLMHLTEAWLAAADAFGDTAFDDALGRTAQAVEHAFVDTATGCIAELPLGAADNRFEPGHQFEWFYLADAAGARVAHTGLRDALARAFVFAERHGVDPLTGGVSAALDAQGACLDGTQRIWAQTEYLRALATHGGTPASAPLATQAARFAARFLHPRGWFECKTADGQVSRADMPSTTPYHLATAYAALPSGA
ncbi:AGE family epimerase/isomerase [Burkholderia stagnalis]|uniref:AGE family epimerase/isomerase n=1 Tax=Burkholderia stagnalis TaxID=1503054 RepID=UPI000F584996|nr:AGE family epimerase/isomerase [Burkholderia stagnalis]RQQ48510.1 N-acylglucosamine 2-epimerase [Burkholderia stagnalis]RQX88058.1 N-acylglucosamine 2-epimerase [Burkholderia stagnalis]RQY07847.1 N-acylglucosamine 2-epimerase [Burkholderia stagnalis]RQY23390.1 N-acylglucosamine 2-epimerase [Burkholderia stagnalis]